MFDVVIYSVLGAFYFIVVLSQMLVVILENRQPVKTVAWLMVLFFLPVVGLVIYFFFGRNRKREHFVSKACASQLARRSAVRFYQGGFPDLPADYRPLIKLFRRQSGAFPYSDNKLRIFTCGEEMLDNLLRDIARAQHHIHVEFYIIEDDCVGRMVRDALMAKVREGVSVRLIYDDVGCWHVSRHFFEDMRNEGIDARAFLKVRFPRFTNKVNYRNHRKLIIIDGQVGFIGGMNVAERYIRGGSWGEWRDTHLMLKGEAVYGLQTVFLTDWYLVDRTLITSAKYFPKIDNQGVAKIQIVTGEPIGPWKEIMQGLAMAIYRARKYFYIQTPYFLPTETILVALQTAALSGVDIRLMVPWHADSRLTHWATCSYLADMLKAGVKVFFYRKGFLHSKLMVSDDQLATIGSTNMDFRSFEHNFEVNAFVYDTEFALQMREVFLQDQHDCDQLHLKHWEKRPYSRKMLESFVRLLSPLL